jgi:hypothetical protein
MIAPPTSAAVRPSSFARISKCFLSVGRHFTGGASKLAIFRVGAGIAAGCSDEHTLKDNHVHSRFGL